MKYFLLVISLLVIPNFVFAAAGDVDLALEPEKVYLSKSIDNLIRGEQVRAYTYVVNLGDKDATGLVVFSLGNTVIGQAAVSLTAQGVKDEVFVDFIVPNNDFNILVQVVNVTPQDQNIDNNEILSAMYYPQNDNDGDGQGDKVDSDDDNDGLLDTEEEVRGLDKNKADTDGDGVNDLEDRFPLDASKYKEEPVKPIIPEKINPAPVVEQKEIKSLPAATPKTETKKSNQQSTTISADNVSPKTDSGMAASNKNSPATELVGDYYDLPPAEILKTVRINVTPLNWNTFAFSFVTNVSNLDVSILDSLWNFGDGTMDKRGGEHRYWGLGDYYVTLKVKGPFDNYLYDSVTVRVKFWSSTNYWLWISVLAIIGLILILGRRVAPAAAVKPTETVGRPLRKPRKRER